MYRTLPLLKIKLHKFQTLVLDSIKKIINATAGIQGGKTTIGALWLGRAMHKYSKQTDNFIMVAPTYKILQQATLPRFLSLFKDRGHYNAQRAEFKLLNGGTIYVRTSTDPESLEGITDVRAIWCDEAGRFSRYFWENVEGRAAIKQAQVLNTTTPYALNWLKDMHDDWKAGKRDDVEFFNFRSIDNPYFPVSEYERQRGLLDPRRFAMKYDGEFGKMIGLVYETMPTVQSFQLPAGTKYYAGIDWGFRDPFIIHTRAVTPDGLQYQVAEFGKSNMLPSDMIQAMISRHRLYNYQLVFCDPSRPEYIKDFNAHGIKAIASDNNITVGIARHQELINSNRFFVFRDLCPMTLDEASMYHYPEPDERGIDDDNKEPVPVDATNHFLDGLRYCTMGLLHLAKNPGYIETLKTNKPPKYEKIN